MKNLLNPNDPAEAVLLELYSEENPIIAEAFNAFDGDLNKLYSFLSNYRNFNDVFAPCVISLASKLHLEFHAIEHPALGSEIAAGVYKACHHEYHEQINGLEFTHCRLSRRFVDILAHLVEYPLDPNKRTKLVDKFINLIKIGYGLSGGYNSGFSLGFHIASEYLAAFEFATIDNLTKHHFQAIYSKMNINADHTVEAWHWIEVHSEVEIEHFKEALESYHKTKGTHINPEDVARGIRHFGKVQEEFLIAALEQAANIESKQVELN